MTVADLVASYMALHVKPNLKSAARLERSFKANVLPTIGAVSWALCIAAIYRDALID